MIRTFIAIEIPRETKELLAWIQEQLKQSRARVRWVRTDSIHLTLKFLGNIHSSKVDDIATAVAQAVSNQSPLGFCAAGLGCFPSKRNPRVIWVGVQGEVERLGQIQSRLESGLERLGFTREKRPFHPHLTIGRLKDKRRCQELIETMDSLKLPEFNSFDVAEIILYKSDLKPTGAIYTKLHRMSLAGRTPA
jgi:2'-5' RNA ligase